MTRSMSWSRRCHSRQTIRRHKGLRTGQESISVHLQIGREGRKTTTLWEALKLVQTAVGDETLRLTFEGLRSFSLLTFGDGSVYLDYTKEEVRQSILILNTGSRYDRLPPRVEAAPLRLRNCPTTVTIIWNPATERLVVEWSIAPWLQVHEETILPGIE